MHRASAGNMVLIPIAIGFCFLHTLHAVRIVQSSSDASGLLANTQLVVSSQEAEPAFLKDAELQINRARAHLDKYEHKGKSVEWRDFLRPIYSIVIENFFPRPLADLESLGTKVADVIVNARERDAKSTLSEAVEVVEQVKETLLSFSKNVDDLTDLIDEDDSLLCLRSGQPIDCRKPMQNIISVFESIDKTTHFLQELVRAASFAAHTSSKGNPGDLGQLQDRVHQASSICQNYGKTVYADTQFLLPTFYEDWSAEEEEKWNLYAGSGLDDAWKILGEGSRFITRFYSEVARPLAEDSSNTIASLCNAAGGCD